MFTNFLDKRWDLMSVHFFKSTFGSSHSASSAYQKVSRTGALGWTEHWVKAPKCALPIKKVKKCDTNKVLVDKIPKKLFHAVAPSVPSHLWSIPIGPFCLCILDKKLLHRPKTTRAWKLFQSVFVIFKFYDRSVERYETEGGGE